MTAPSRPALPTRIAVVGNYLPRRCGIATFTTDLCDAKGRWRKEAWSAFNWFLGDNDLQIALYDATTGGCRDGLHPDRANENQGAESTLSFLMALLEMRKLEESDGTANKV